MDDDPDGRRRDCVGTRNRQPKGDAIQPGASRLAVLDVLSAPVLRFGFRRVLHHQPFQVGGQAAVLGLGAQHRQSLELG